jgi:hypothetical protein
MRVAGTREDGALWLTLDGGMSVILCEDRCSPPMDPQAAERLGPWRDAHGVSGGDRRELARRLDKARTCPVSTFLLDMRKVKVSTVHGKKKLKFEYETDDDGKTIGDEPDKDDGKDDGKTIGDEPGDDAVITDPTPAADVPDEDTEKKPFPPVTK